VQGFRCFLRAVTLVAAHLIKKPRIDRPGFFFSALTAAYPTAPPPTAALSRGMMLTTSILDRLVKSLRILAVSHSLSC
jgi:hypothetical protein